MSLTRSIAILDIYWLIHNTTCMMGYCGPSVKTAYPLLRQSVPRTADTAIDDTPSAKFLGMQPRRSTDPLLVELLLGHHVAASSVSGLA